MQFSFTQVLASYAVVLPLVAGGTWAVQTNRIEALKDQVEQFKQSEEWALPETLRKIRESSIELKGAIAKYEHLRALEPKIIRLEEDARKKDGALQETSEKLAQLQGKLAESDHRLREVYAKPEDFSLRQGESFSTAAGDIVVGLVDTNVNDCAVNINDNSHRMEPGNSVVVIRAGSECRVILASFSFHAETAKFAVRCRDSEKRGTES